MAKHNMFSDEIRIGACADYLLDIPIGVITHRWGVSETVLNNWIARTGSFRLRRKSKHNPQPTTFWLVRPMRCKLLPPPPPPKPTRFYRPFRDMIDT